jgi:hypothetical protein
MVLLLSRDAFGSHFLLHGECCAPGWGHVPVQGANGRIRAGVAHLKRNFAPMP